MQGVEDRPYRDRLAVLVTMHAKERVMAPILRDELGLLLEVAQGVNTDQFGTFSRDMERTGSQLDAARAKVAAGLAWSASACVGLASEGSFGPHPYMPFVPFGTEIVLMIDRDSGLELIGYDASADTNFAHTVARDVLEAMAFAYRVGFPSHALIVMGCKGEQPAPEIFLAKEIVNAAALEEAVRTVLRLCGAAFVETDMRAHRNPTRMAAIERATRDLARRFHSRCPNCGCRGFDATERIPGLPCAACGAPTRAVLAEVLTCGSCTYRAQRAVTTLAAADPGQCDHCNP